MQSFALTCAGAGLLVAWLQNRIVSALALWGFANVIGAAGILSLMLGFTLHQQPWLAIGGILLPRAGNVVHKLAYVRDFFCSGRGNRLFVIQKSLTLFTNLSKESKSTGLQR
jgi:hypothetical protein